MRKGFTIRAKITALIFSVSLVAVLAISFFTYEYNVKLNREKVTNNLRVTVDARAAYMATQLERITNGLQALQTSDKLTASSTTAAPADFDPFAIDAPPTEGDSAIAEATPADPVKDFLTAQKELFGFAQLYIVSKSGAIRSTTDAGVSGNMTDPDGTTFEKSSEGIHLSNVLRQDKNYVLFAGAPLPSNEIIIAKIILDDAFAVLEDHSTLGKTGEVVIVKQDPFTKKIIYASPLRNDPTAALKVFTENDPLVAGIQKVFSGSDGDGSGYDYRNKRVVQIWKKLPQPGWAVLGTIEVAEAEGDAGSLLSIFVFAGLCVLLLTTFLSLVLTRALTRPLLDMRNTLGLVAQGILPEASAHNHRDDEYGAMAERVDELVQTLRNNAQFARQIGEGNYQTEFKPASDNDLLGVSLIEMRNNLIENERKDTERNWIVRGVAEISEILRAHDSIEGLGDDVIKFILGKINAIQGAFYVVNDDDPRNKIIEMRASFAYNRKKYLKAKFKFAEGLVGQAVAEQDTVLRTEIPAEYVTITSGILGDQRPKCILIVPLITNEEVYGVLEFAGFKKFDSSQVNFVKELSLILARTIFNIKVNERTRKLLEESQAMSNELKEKQEVLRQNAEEMQATQEELERTNRELENQIEEVNRTQSRMQLLLENASEVITIYEKDKTVRYISPSVQTILGYSQKDMQGHSDIEKVHPDYRQVFNDLFTRMTESPNERVTVQFEYKTKEGNYVWIEATGANQMSNRAIQGFIVNARDITERRRAEQEQRMRSKMQALSENSLDLITRVENGVISYINPMIEQYTGKNLREFLNKKVVETELDKSMVEGWLNVVENVNATNSKASAEMEIPSEMGQRVMQVNAIPEFDENNSLESVLVVSHDITERKMIELEIQNKNKKITESINYSKRIQNAILPNNRVISRTLPDSFILYKPRDVVSGDFPWFVTLKDEIFIAAVDCTGHGVPGAMLSLIGYFLLNDIVRSRKITEPGKILDLLDEGVTTTLRQDEDPTTRDGMDIGLCKINLKDREVEYAGAHRPLYIMKKGVMEEIKGNKFPIGGGIFKNQTNFTNTKVKMEAGDSIFFSSDGYPDQFGGPEGRKLGPKKVRELIERAHTLPMADAMKIFDDEWESWRGDHKQTDDVLLIGIKF